MIAVQWMRARQSQGNVVSNDDYGPGTYGAGLVLSVNGQSVGSNGLTINGQYGTLTIQRSGSYSYKAKLTIQMGQITSRMWIMRDADGDRDNARLSVRVR